MLANYKTNYSKRETSDGPFASDTSVQVGDITRTHGTIIQARQTKGAQVTLPDNATFRRMHHLDAMRRTTIDEYHNTSTFRTLTIRLNGSSEMQLTINIQEFRAAMGLPNYNLIAHGILANFRRQECPL
ncbi:hypothetical protein PHPALM_31271 [Phytophthora palmivora]|uniref:Uncharacterized protein n=1 Tax=Phytophthora palmivora TaxID=4796 RepID=A0A2P4X310_9STRA|nr:hypothetical protein PHPALM_31271 [Phytophthora palmivora]